MTHEEITHRIKKLDDRERFLALTSAPIGIAVGVVLTAFTIHLNPPLQLHGKINPKHVSESLILLEGGARILLSGIVVAAALSRGGDRSWASHCSSSAPRWARLCSRYPSGCSGGT